MWDAKSAKIHAARLKWKPTINIAAAMQHNSDKMIIGTNQESGRYYDEATWMEPKSKKSYR